MCQRCQCNSNHPLTPRAGDYGHVGAPRERRVYEEVGGDAAKLTTLMTAYLDEYNLEHTAPLHLGGWGGAAG